MRVLANDSQYIFILVSSFCNKIMFMVLAVIALAVSVRRVLSLVLSRSRRHTGSRSDGFVGHTSLSRSRPDRTTLHIVSC